MLRTLIWFIGSLILFIGTAPVALIAFIFRNKKDEAGPHPVGIWFAKIFTAFTGFIAGTKVEINGIQNLPTQTACYIGNHQSYFDALIALIYLGPIKPMLIKKELIFIPLANLYMILLGCVPLDRKNLRKSVKSLNKIAAKLKAGQSVVIFPEGTRSHGPNMSEFKAGAFKPAMKAKVPIIPFALDDAYLCFEEKHYFKPATIKVQILQPVLPNEYEGLSSSDLAQLVQQKIQKQLDEMRKA